MYIEIIRIKYSSQRLNTLNGYQLSDLLGKTIPIVFYSVLKNEPQCLHNE